MSPRIVDRDELGLKRLRCLPVQDVGVAVDGDDSGERIFRSRESLALEDRAERDVPRLIADLGGDGSGDFLADHDRAPRERRERCDHVANVSVLERYGDWRLLGLLGLRKERDRLFVSRRNSYRRWDGRCSVVLRVNHRTGRLDLRDDLWRGLNRRWSCSGRSVRRVGGFGDRARGDGTSRSRCWSGDVAVLQARPGRVVLCLPTGNGDANFTIAALHTIWVRRVEVDHDANYVLAELRVPNVGDTAAGYLVVAAVRHLERGSLQIDDDPGGRIEREVLHFDSGVYPDHHFSLPGRRDYTD